MFAARQAREPRPDGPDYNGCKKESRLAAGGGFDGQPVREVPPVALPDARRPGLISRWRRRDRCPAQLALILTVSVICEQRRSRLSVPVRVPAEEQSKEDRKRAQNGTEQRTEDNRTGTTYRHRSDNASGHSRD